MRRAAFSLAVLGAGLGLTLLARERQPTREGRPVGPASRQLMAEHEVILAVVDAIQREADHIRGGSSADDSRVRQMLDFARNFADRCHHAKEERYYFPAVLVYGGQGARGLIDELTAEHAYGRAVLEEIDYVLREDDRAAEAIVGERLSSYAAMLRRHIRKEDERLYQKAGAFLPEAEERALSIGFERLEDVELGSGFHERYHRLAEELSRSSGRLPDSTRR